LNIRVKAALTGAMNRFAPLIDRAPARSPAAARPWAVDPFEQMGTSSGDLRLFAMAFAGGLVFFGTLLA
jgi:hypothetical protein